MLPMRTEEALTKISNIAQKLWIYFRNLKVRDQVAMESSLIEFVLPIKQKETLSIAITWNKTKPKKLKQYLDKSLLFQLVFKTNSLFWLFHYINKSFCFVYSSEFCRSTSTPLSFLTFPHIPSTFYINVAFRFFS